MKDERILRPNNHPQLNVDVNLLQLGLSKCRSLSEDFLVKMDKTRKKIEGAKSSGDSEDSTMISVSEVIGVLNEIKEVCRSTIYSVDDYYEEDEFEKLKKDNK